MTTAHTDMTDALEILVESSVEDGEISASLKRLATQVWVGAALHLKPASPVALEVMAELCRTDPDQQHLKTVQTIKIANNRYKETKA